MTWHLLEYSRTFWDDPETGEPLGTGRVGVVVGRDLDDDGRPEEARGLEFTFGPDENTELAAENEDDAQEAIIALLSEVLDSDE